MISNSQIIDNAFEEINRVDFVRKIDKHKINIDAPLPIGYGQTISQPSTVRMMLEWLDAQPGHKVLDIGSGSGWTSALLSKIVGSSGRVFAVEKIPELVEFGSNNCINAGVESVSFFEAGNQYGLPTHGPFDRILVSASAQTLPVELLDQLIDGGKLVIPVRNDILEITKIDNKEYNTTVHPGFLFVPLI